MLPVNHMPLTQCPKCNHPLDCATSVDADDSAPIEGDLSICINCATPLVFDELLMLRVLTQDEIDGLPPLSQIELRQAIRAVNMLINRGH